VLTIVAVALVAIGVTSLGTGSSSSSAATKRTSTVGKGVVQSTVSGNGTLEPAQKVELSFGASGEVTKIYVKAGEKVTKGQVLAEVDSSSARASLASAEAALLEAEEAVETAAEAEEDETEEDETEETAYDGEGATTEFVDLVEGTTEETEPVEPEIESANVTREKEKAEREAEKAKKEAEAAKKAAAKAQQEVAAAKKSAAAASGKTETAAPEETTPAATSSGGGETSGAATSSGGGESSGGETSGTATGGSSMSLPTAEANLREAELTVKSARQEVRETTLRAPISGTIASVSGSVGETVSGGSSGGGTSEAGAGGATGGESTGGESSGSFMVLAQLHRLKMEVSFSESDIGKVRQGQTATVSIDSMEGTELAGEVTKVSVLPSEGSTSVVEYPATILLTQSAKGLRAGMSASAEVVVEQVKNAVTVPTEAITGAGSGKTVTVEEGGQEVTKTVTTGLEGDETTEVVSGLKAGQTLVLPEVTVATATGGEGESGTKETLSGFGAAAAAGGFPGGAGGGPPSFGGG
jgi:multidrug efflux pump subunit AcrA (membrane-fusion protein)